jgi:HEAT repeat protein
VTSEAVRAVLERLHDEDVSPRAKACLALRVMGIEKADDVKAVVKALGERLRREKETQAVIRYEAAITLRRFAEDAAPVIRDLIHGLVDGSSWEIRHACAAVLWRAAITKKDGPNELAVEAMVHRLQATTYPPAHEEKLELIIGLGSMGRPKDLKQFEKVVSVLKLYANAAPTTQGRIALSLWAYAGLVALLEDAKQADPHLAAIARYTKRTYKVEIRVQAIGALAAFGTRSKKYVPAMLELLGDKEPAVVSAAAAALTHIGESEDRERIINAYLSLLKNNAAPKKDASALEKSNAVGKAGVAIFALVSMKANLKDVHDEMDKVRKDADADRGLRTLVAQAQKQLSNPPKEKDKK